MSFAVTCPNCRQDYTLPSPSIGAAMRCGRCGRDFRITTAIPVAQAVAPQKPRGIVCKVCDTGTLSRARTHRFTLAGAVIGWILIVPSLLWFVFVFSAPLIGSNAAHIPAAIALAMPVAIPFLIGCLLVSAKTILRCNHCGASTAAD